MNYETWATTFKPVDNHLDTNAAYDGKMFETYGDELEFLKTIDPRRIWTLRDEDGGSIITTGFGWVNRMGYFITEQPWTDDDLYIQLSQSVECECYDDDRFGYGGDPECKECEGNGYIEKWLD